MVAVLVARYHNKIYQPLAKGEEREASRGASTRGIRNWVTAVFRRTDGQTD
jgi:hypothetical protein